MGEKPENSKDEQEQPKGKRRVDLSVPQVAGSAVAAVVAAKLASSFGVYGTILGAGVVSALATCGGTVFQHFFKRTGEQIRDVAVQTKPKPRQVPVTSEGRPVPRTFRSDAAMDATKAMATGAPLPAARPATQSVPTTTTWGMTAGPGAEETTAPPQPSADAEQVTALPRIPLDDDRTQLLDTGAVADLLPDDPDRTRVLGTVDPVDPDKTQLIKTGRDDRVDEATRVLRPATDLPQPPPPDEEFTDGTVHRTTVKSWKRPLIAAAVVFGVTMGGITTYEIASGHSFSGDKGATTFREAFSGKHSSGDSDPAPGTSQQPSGGSSTGTDGETQQNGDGPGSDGNTTPTPTPSNSGSSGTGSGTGSGSDSGSDTGSGSGDDGSTSSPTPTPTPSQSSDGSGADNGSGSDAGQQAPTE